MAITAGTWSIVDGRIGFQPIADRSTTQNHPMGTIVKARDTGATAYGEGEFIYCLGVASAAAKDWVTYNLDNGIITRMAANAIGPVGVCMSALTASYYGWVQISGKAVGKTLTGYTDNGAVFCAATGAIDDASVVGDLINLAKGASASNSLQAEFEISRPYCNDRHANK